MPTGYTDDINDETTLSDFAMRCARAFVRMRDEPVGALEADLDYYLKQLADNHSRLFSLAK